MRHAVIRTAVVLVVMTTATPAWAATHRQRFAFPDMTCDAQGTIDIRPGLSNVPQAEKLRFRAPQLTCGADTATMSGTLRAPAADCANAVASKGRLTVTWSDASTSTVHFSLSFRQFGGAPGIGSGIVTMKGHVTAGRFVGDRARAVGGVDYAISGSCESNPISSWFFFAHHSKYLRPLSFSHTV